MASWDAAQYLRYASHRERPGVELIARIPDVDASTVVDLGCGTGDLTARLAARWPAAGVTGVDSSAEMLERARASHPRIRWVTGDIDRWEPDGPVDVLYSNATLHWLDDHAHLFPRLLGAVRRGGALAVQMPNNWTEPTHLIPAEVLAEPGWPAAARKALIRDRVASPRFYLDTLAAASAIDLWETTYHQVLAPVEGSHPVLEWVKGSLLRPVMAALAGASARFEAELAVRYSAAYPGRPDGSVVLPFRRLFIVAGR
jgi:trans-aconitate 2-methyltransferase